MSTDGCSQLEKHVEDPSTGATKKHFVELLSSSFGSRDVFFSFFLDMNQITF